MNAVDPTAVIGERDDGRHERDADVDAGTRTASATRKLYLAAWRWHFYAGLYVIPFLTMLAVTGLAMLWTYTLVGRDGERTGVTVDGAPLALAVQADAARAAVPNGDLVQYIAPLADDRVALFAMELAEETRVVAIDPYTATVLGESSRENSWYTLFNDLHGSLLLGVSGDRMIEIAASLAMVLIATGVYLWWPRDRRLLSVLVPDLAARGRAAWKTWHVSVGMWISLLMFVFLLSGLAWAGVWGEKLVQAWNTFPAEKWDAPLSDDTHVAMNHGGTKGVPWALEQTKMPLSVDRTVAAAPFADPLSVSPGAGSPDADAGRLVKVSAESAGHHGASGDATPGGDVGDAAADVPRAALPVTMESVSALARTLGFDQRFQLNLPMGEQGVWTISRDSMSSDSTAATTDRTVHVDRYSGEVLADVRFADYSVGGQAMAVGIGFHMGTLGLWNVASNTLFCLAVIFLCVSGTLMWWRRRPSGAKRLAAPPLPADLPLWKGAVLIGLAISLFFPLAGLTLLAVLALDVLLLSRVPALKRALS